jgi:hypothetical protein
MSIAIHTPHIHTLAQVCTSDTTITRVPTPSPTIRGTSPTSIPTASPTTDAPLVQIVFTDPDNVPTVVRDACDVAVAMWNDIVSNTLPLTPLPPDLSDASELGCPAHQFPSGTTQLTGLTIFVSVGAIDFRGGTLAQASACAFSSDDGRIAFGTLRPRVGWMTFDEDDVEMLSTSAALDRVVLHEIGHVLGIGVLWSELGLLSIPPTPFEPGNPTYTGRGGKEGYEAVGGPAGEKLVVDCAGCACLPGVCVNGGLELALVFKCAHAKCCWESALLG